MVINTTVSYTDAHGHPISTREAAVLAGPYHKRHGGLTTEVDRQRLQAALQRIRSGLSIPDILAKLTAWAYRPSDHTVIGWGTNPDTKIINRIISNGSGDLIVDTQSHTQSNLPVRILDV